MCVCVCVCVCVCTCVFVCVCLTVQVCCVCLSFVVHFMIYFLLHHPTRKVNVLRKWPHLTKHVYPEKTPRSDTFSLYLSISLSPCVCLTNSPFPQRTFVPYEQVSLCGLCLQCALPLWSAISHSRNWNISKVTYISTQAKLFTFKTINFIWICSLPSTPHSLIEEASLGHDLTYFLKSKILTSWRKKVLWYLFSKMFLIL